MAGAKAREETRQVKTIVRLFADLETPVLVDECSEVKVFSMRKIGASLVRGPQVNFEKKVFVAANDGEVFEVALDTTDELDLQKVLAPKPGKYTAYGYDKAGKAIPRAARLITVEAEAEDDGDEGDEGDEGDGDEGDEGDERQSGGGEAGVMKILGRIVEKQLGAQAKNGGTRDSDAVEVLREEMRRQSMSHEDTVREMRNSHAEEVRRLKNEHETALRTIQSKHDSDTNEIWLATKNAISTTNNKAEEERKEFNADRREWNAERKSLVDRYEARILAMASETNGDARETRIRLEGEARETRMQYETKISDLQGRLLTLQQEANVNLLRIERQAMELNLAKQLAERDASDSQLMASKAITQMEQERAESHEQIKVLATRAGSGGFVSQAMAALPAAKEIIRALKEDGGQMPTDAKQLLAYVASQPNLVKQFQQPEIMQAIQQMMFPDDGSSWVENVPAPGQQQQQQQQQQPAPGPQWAAEPVGVEVVDPGQPPPATATSTPAPAPVVEPAPPAPASAPPPAPAADPSEAELERLTSPEGSQAAE